MNLPMYTLSQMGAVWRSKRVVLTAAVVIVVVIAGLLYQGVFDVQDSPRRQLWIAPDTNPDYAQPRESHLGRNASQRLKLPDSQGNPDLSDGAFSQVATYHRMSNPCDVSGVMSSLVTWQDLSRYTSCQRIFYNKMPKCGSRTVLKTFQKLGRSYQFTVRNWVHEHRFFYSPQELNKFLVDFKQLEPPFLLSKHQHFINFTENGIVPPMYINVIRDPVSRLISHYYYSKYGNNNRPVSDIRSSYNQSLDECVARDLPVCMEVHQFLPYVCGQTPQCRERTAWAAAQAKTTFHQSFLVIGLTEDLPSFVEVLEILAPQFFKNISLVFKNMGRDLKQKYQTWKKPQTSQATIAKLQRHLHYEYDFYNFAKQQFYKLHRRVKFLHKQKLAQDTDYVAHNARDTMDTVDASDVLADLELDGYMEVGTR